LRFGAFAGSISAAVACRPPPRPPPWETVVTSLKDLDEATRARLRARGPLARDECVELCGANADGPFLGCNLRMPDEGGPEQLACRWEHSFRR
jgi:hypothetical protein